MSGEVDQNDDNITEQVGLAGAAYLRTLFPALWGSLMTMLVATFTWIPQSVVDWLNSPVVTVAVIGALSVGWYWLWNKISAHVPTWLQRVALGSVKTPTYGG